MLSKLKSLRALGQPLTMWWNAPGDHYDTQTEYFAHRGLLDGLQLLIGCCTALLASIPLIVQFSPAGPTSHWAHVVSYVFSASAMAWTALWWFGPWPTHRWSIAFILFADIGITGVSLMDTNHLAGLFGVNALALISLYAMFFEGPRVLVLHSLWALASLVTFIVLLATGPDADPYLAVTKSVAVLVSLVVAPAMVHFGIWLLRNDANESMTDHLTGLLNRRGLNLQFESLLRSSPGTGTVMVAVIDLDRFKSINDSEGHDVGDTVLVRCARRVQHNVPASTLVARVGGEEFVVADLVTPSDVPVFAERIRRAIAAPAERAPVTASLGVITMQMPTTPLRAVNAEARLAAAFRQADHAMFVSKRKGGNAVTYLPSDRRPPVGLPVGQLEIID